MIGKKWEQVNIATRDYQSFRHQWELMLKMAVWSLGAVEMGLNIFTAQKMYLTGFDKIFIWNTWRRFSRNQPNTSLALWRDLFSFMIFYIFRNSFRGIVEVTKDIFSIIVLFYSMKGQYVTLLKCDRISLVNSNWWFIGAGHFNRNVALAVYHKWWSRFANSASECGIRKTGQCTGKTEKLCKKWKEMLMLLLMSVLTD